MKKNLSYLYDIRRKAVTSENNIKAENKLWVERVARGWQNEAVLYLYIPFLK